MVLLSSFEFLNARQTMSLVAVATASRPKLRSQPLRIPKMYVARFKSPNALREISRLKLEEIKADVHQAQIPEPAIHEHYKSQNFRWF